MLINIEEKQYHCIETLESILKTGRGKKLDEVAELFFTKRGDYDGLENDSNFRKRLMQMANILKKNEDDKTNT